MYKSHKRPVAELHIVDQYMMEVPYFPPFQIFTGMPRYQKMSFPVDFARDPGLNLTRLTARARRPPADVLRGNLFQRPRHSRARGCRDKLLAFISLSPSSTPAGHVAHVRRAKGCSSADR